jgi:malonate transporter MadM subunit
VRGVDAPVVAARRSARREPGAHKSICVMVFTPVLARFMKPDNPQSAMVFGGLAGTDRTLVPYGALVATFHTGFGCLLGPSALYLPTKAIPW